MKKKLNPFLDKRNNIKIIVCLVFLIMLVIFSFNKITFSAKGEMGAFYYNGKVNYEKLKSKVESDKNRLNGDFFDIDMDNYKKTLGLGFNFGNGLDYTYMDEKLRRYKVRFSLGYNDTEYYYYETYVSQVGNIFSTSNRENPDDEYAVLELVKNDNLSLSSSSPINYLKIFVFNTYNKAQNRDLTVDLEYLELINKNGEKIINDDDILKKYNIYLDDSKVTILNYQLDITNNEFDNNVVLNAALELENFVSDYKDRPKLVYEHVYNGVIATDEELQFLKDQGFKTIKIPVTWYNHMDATGTIDPEWFDEVNSVVDRVLSYGFNVIVGIYSEANKYGWIMADWTSFNQYVDAYRYFILQIAENFKNYDSRLIIDGPGEVRNYKREFLSSSLDDYSVSDQINQIFVDEIRRSGYNNTNRFLVVNTYAAYYGNINHNGQERFVLPRDTADNKLFVGVHDYTIRDDGTLASLEFFSGKGKSYLSKYNIIMGEYGVLRDESLEKKIKLMNRSIPLAYELGIPMIYWDDGGGYALMKKKASEWDTQYNSDQVAKAMIDSYQEYVYENGDLTTVVKPIAENYCKTGLVYNGENQIVTNMASTGYTFSNNSGKNAGDYKVTAKLSSGYQWNDGTTGDVTITCLIEKATPIIELSSQRGSVEVNESVIFKEKSNIAGTFKNTSRDSSIASVSSMNNQISANTDVDVTVTGKSVGETEITVLFTPADMLNYKTVESKYTVSVLKQSLINVEKPTAVNYCKTGLVYNGQNQILTNTASTGYTFSNNSGKNAGDYKVIAKLSSGYQWSDSTTGDVMITCSISKATPIIELSSQRGSVEVNKTVVFKESANIAGTFKNTSGNGSIASVTNMNNQISANTNVDATVTGKSVGETSITVLFTPADVTNYKTVEAKYTVSVLKPSLINVVKPIAENYCKSGLIYNGENQVLTNVAGTGYTFSNNNGKNAGDYKVTAKLSSGYQWNDGTTTDVIFSCLISKATPVIELSSESGVVAANGSVIFKEKANVAGVFKNTSGNSSIASVSSTNNQVLANTYVDVTVVGKSVGETEITVLFIPADTINYKLIETVNNGGKKFKVRVYNSVAKPTTANYCKTGLVYNGQNQIVTNTASTGYIFSNNNGKNAGDYNVTAKLLSGYVWNDGTTTDVTVTCSIAKAMPKIELSSESGMVEVNKSIVFKERANVAGVFKNTSGNSSIASVSSTNNQVLANTYVDVTVTGKSVGDTVISVLFTPSDISNYYPVEVISNGGRQYVVSVIESNDDENIKNSVSKPTTANYCKTGLVYNGQNQIVTNTASTGYIFSNNNGKNAGDYKVTAKLSSGYVWNDGTTTDVTVTCSIAKAMPKIELSSESGMVEVNKSIVFKERANVAGVFKNTSGNSSIASVSSTNNQVLANTYVDVTVTGKSVGDTVISVLFTPSDISNYYPIEVIPNGGKQYIVSVVDLDIDNNVNSNPQTGNIIIFITWIIGGVSLFFGLWYLKRIQRNNI